MSASDPTLEAEPADRLAGGTSEAGLRPGWILGARGDALIFTGPILAGLALIYYASSRGILYDEMPVWMFGLLIVACDVAHVYATAFRVYLDPNRFKARPGLFLGAPIACFAVGVALYSMGSDVFWRVLAYLAVWHFVRQQWGWVAYARAKAGEGRVDRRLDQLMIYGVTLYPIVYWHTHLPRSFDWFLAGDFAGVPGGISAWVNGAAATSHWVIVALFAARQVQRAAMGLGINWAKIQIVATTWVAWYVGIVALNSDIAFTALNVLSHGVPYLAVVWSVERIYAARGIREDGAPVRRWAAKWFQPRLALILLGALMLVGYGEEWLWHGLVWDDLEGLFPRAWSGALSPGWLALLVPLLAMPQATHYVLDGWLWKRAKSAGNVELESLFDSESR